MGDAGILYFYLQNLTTLNLSPHHPNLWPDSDRSQTARQSLWCSLQRPASPGPQGEAEKGDKIWGRYGKQGIARNNQWPAPASLNSFFPAELGFLRTNQVCAPSLLALCTCK